MYKKRSRKYYICCQCFALVNREPCIIQHSNDVSISVYYIHEWNCGVTVHMYRSMASLPSAIELAQKIISVDIHTIPVNTRHMCTFPSYVPRYLATVKPV